VLGRTIGNYVVREKIGEGGMGVVYLAEHPRIGKKVAIKVLLPEYGHNPDVVARFFTEARAANAIRNEHIIDIIDFGELEDRSSYIIMEWLEGRSLTTALEKEGRFPLDRALHIAGGMGRALVAAHARGIVHRDLKPDNIYLIRRGNDPDFAKVLDFGIAKLLGQEAGAGAELKTKTGAIIGTPMYMSPEQCRGIQVDERSDLYSFGVILYQMLTGRLPFVAEGLGELLLKHMTESPPPPRSLQPSIPERIEEVLLIALAKDPAHRFHKVEAMLAALGGEAFERPTVTLPAASSTGAVPASDAPTGATASSRPTVLTGDKAGMDTLGTASGESVASAEPAARRRSPALIFGGVVALALLATVALVVTGGHKATVVPAAATVAASPAPTPPAASSVAVTAPGAPERVRITLRTVPPSATIKIDGELVANPFSRTVPPESVAHRIEVSAEGFEPETRMLTFDAAREIELALRPTARGEVQRSRSVKTHTAGTAAAPRPGATAETPRAPKATAPDDPARPVYKGTRATLLDNPYETKK
jgi:serine/threonine-protein kinase